MGTCLQVWQLHHKRQSPLNCKAKRDTIDFLLGGLKLKSDSLTNSLHTNRGIHYKD